MAEQGSRRVDGTMPVLAGVMVRVRVTWGQKVRAVRTPVLQSNIRGPPTASGSPRTTVGALADPALASPDGTPAAT